MKCPNCKREVAYGATACGICGRPLKGDGTGAGEGRSSWSTMSTAATDWRAEGTSAAGSPPPSTSPSPMGGPVFPDAPSRPARGMPTFGGGQPGQGAPRQRAGGTAMLRGILPVLGVIVWIAFKVFAHSGA